MVSNSPSAHWGFSMGKQHSGKDKPAVAGAALIANGAEVTPIMALASLERPDLETSQGSSSIAIAPTQFVAAPKIGLANIDASRIAPKVAEPELPLERKSDHDSPRKSGQESCVASGESSAEASSAAPVAAGESEPKPALETPPPRVNRFTMLAACLALAAALGGMVGALAAFALARPQPAPVIAAGKFSSEEIQALKENVVQARVDLAALKVSIDAGNRGATTQFTKLAERIERMERNAAEPAAKLNKAVENIERIARAESAASLKDVTGSIAPTQPIAGKPGGLEGWVLRDVHRGTAFLEGRNGIVEVEQGDLVPGLGRIDAIRKQDGRWTVVTSKGTITAPPR
jgi:hypothetical protein